MPHHDDAASIHIKDFNIENTESELDIPSFVP